MNTNAIAKLVKEIATQMDGEDGNITFQNAYSGRGMYGNTCVAVSGDLGDCMKVIGEVIKLLHEDDRDDIDFDEAVDLLMDFQRDQLGRGVVIYWSDLSIECDEQENDGQPSESQEWESFDPDC